MQEHCDVYSCTYIFKWTHEYINENKLSHNGNIAYEIHVIFNCSCAFFKYCYD